MKEMFNAFGDALSPLATIMTEMVNQQRAANNKPPLRIVFDDKRFSRVFRIVEDNEIALSGV